jgi:mono/diheme cytochrome c family protein
MRHSSLKLSLVASVFLGCLAATAQAQTPPAAPDQSAGRQLVMSRCFQCHTDSMFRAQRQDRRAWEATIYRMMGRGALFTTEERGQMADYLATDFGPNVPRAAPQAH